MKVSLLKTRGTKLSLPLRDVQRFFAVGTELADLAEDILESQGLYRSEFLRGLEKSLADARAGRVQKINSLTELR